MKRVLIPTDFSECANHATNIGMELAKKMNSEVSFLHLMNTPVDWSKLSLEKENLYPETKVAIGTAKDELLKLERRAEKIGVEANSLLLFNQGIEEIHNYISKEKYCLVVMGTHGEKGMQKLMGSNTQNVLKQSPVPVLSVKQSDKSAPMKKIGIASDFQEESLRSFNEILELIKKIGIEIDVVYINTPYTFMESNQIEQAMDSFLGEQTEVKEKRLVYNAKNEERGIGMYIASEKPDMIATITRQHSGLEKIFRPGVTESIINHFELPVLSINQKN
ncbi:MAG TPA: universal stress protein [Salegentibacter sp.]|uniref:universal stress protein n=1 Tax=Salegentibacter sp. TaxID=1903072 RepID=UPI002F95488A